MSLKEIDKNSLHHAYLIEGAREEILPEILEFVKGMEVTHIQLDSFKVDDARNLKSYEFLKAADKKKAFVISVNSFLFEAQNTLLKMFEEPIENTHFFIIVPDASALLKTFVSRFYFISTDQGLAKEGKQVEKFLAMTLPARIEFIKELIAEEEDVPTGVGIPTGVGKEVSLDSARSKSLKFLNAVEVSLHRKLVNNFSGLLQAEPGTFPVQNSLQVCFEHIFKVREFLRMPGSSAKSLMESVALVIPVL